MPRQKRSPPTRAMSLFISSSNKKKKKKHEISSFELPEDAQPGGGEEPVQQSSVGGRKLQTGTLRRH